MSKTTVALVLAVGVAVGCASSGGLKPYKRVDHFPKQQKLDELEQKPTPEGVFEKSDDIRVAEWKLTGPLPDIIGPVKRAPEDALDQLSADVAADVENGVSTEAMRCVARELGEFYLAYGGMPEKGLERFISHRCGATSYTTAKTWRYWEEAVSWEDADKDGQTITPLKEDMLKTAKNLKNAEFGAWYGSNEERSVAMAVIGPRLVDLQPMPMTVPADGKFEIRGRFFDDNADIVSGVINHGLYGWDDCHALPSELPEFGVRCTAVPGDLQAGFEVYTRRRGALVANSRLWQRVWPAGNPASTYVLYGEPTSGGEDGAVGEGDATDGAEPTDEGGTGAQELAAGDTEPATPLAEPIEPAAFDTSPAGMRASIIELINAERAKGKLTPVRAASAQSVEAQKLVPHYWDALRNDDQDTIHNVLYGLLAGRSVEGPIISGSFYTSRVSGGPQDLVSQLIARPGARNVIFGPEIEQLAIGSLYESEAQVLGAMIHGWAFVEDESHTRRVNHFLDHITEARDARGKPKPTKVVSMKTYADDLATKLSNGEIELHVAANAMLNRFAAAHPGQRVSVYYIEVNDPTLIELPDNILDAVPLTVSAVVAPYKPANVPWNVYGVIFAYVVTNDVPTKMVSLPGDAVVLRHDPRSM